MSDIVVSTKWTLRNLLEQYNVVIPIIQRDYAQGRDDEKAKEVRERLDYELNVIQKMGFTDYFLIVQDFVRYAKNQEIPVGAG